MSHILAIVSTMDRRKDLGRLGERIAERFLSDRDIEVVARNLEVGGGELDLVVVVDGVVTAVEVRSVTGSMDVALLFPEAKRARVRRLARDAGCRRVDLVGVRFDRRGVEVRWLRDVR